MSDQVTFFDHPRIGLRSLLRLRWAIAALELLVCLTLPRFIEIQLPTWPLLGCISITLLSNFALSLIAGKRKNYAEGTCLALLIFDTLNLCFMLFISGGAHNPFTSLFLLHIVMGAILLARWRSWLITVINCAAFALLFWSPDMDPAQVSEKREPMAMHAEDSHAHGGHHGHAGHASSYQLHLQGMLASLALTGGCLAFFVGQLRHELLLREQILEKHRGESSRNERFAALATLTAGMAHELSTPLGTIAIVSKELEQKTTSMCYDKDCQEDAALIRAEVDRCQTILQHASRQITAYREADLQPVTGDTFPELMSRYLTPKQLNQLEIHIKSTPWESLLPVEPLLQSLAILIQNACDASTPEQPIILTVDQTNQANSFCVEDQGVGIPKENQSRLGEPFYTTKAPGQGMGLGLFIVRSFVDRMGGQLHIESEPEQGARFTIQLPRTTTQA